jgi:hypothetical protein
MEANSGPYVAFIEPVCSPYRETTDVTIHGEFSSVSSAEVVFTLGGVERRIDPGSVWIDKTTIKCTSPTFQAQEGHQDSIAKVCVVFDENWLDVHEVKPFFRFYHPPKLQEIVPRYCPSAAGVNVRFEVESRGDGAKLVHNGEWEGIKVRLALAGDEQACADSIIIRAQVLSSTSFSCSLPLLQPGCYGVEISLNGQHFTTLASSNVPQDAQSICVYAPTQVSSISPGCGPVRILGNVLRIRGKHFANTMLGVRVRFVLQGVLKIVDATYVDQSCVECPLPYFRHSGTASVEVSFNGGHDYTPSPQAFYVCMAPCFYAISPAFGSSVGGTMLSIGCDFKAEDEFRTNALINISESNFLDTGNIVVRFRVPSTKELISEAKGVLASDCSSIMVDSPCSPDMYSFSYASLEPVLVSVALDGITFIDVHPLQETAVAALVTAAEPIDEPRSIARRTGVTASSTTACTTACTEDKEAEDKDAQVEPKTAQSAGLGYEPSPVYHYYCEPLIRTLSIGSAPSSGGAILQIELHRAIPMTGTLLVRFVTDGFDHQLQQRQRQLGESPLMLSDRTTELEALVAHKRKYAGVEEEKHVFAAAFTEADELEGAGRTHNRQRQVRKWRREGYVDVVGEAVARPDVVGEAVPSMPDAVEPVSMRTIVSCRTPPWPLQKGCSRERVCVQLSFNGVDFTPLTPVAVTDSVPEWMTRDPHMHKAPEARQEEQEGQQESKHHGKTKEESGSGASGNRLAGEDGRMDFSVAVCSESADGKSSGVDRGAYFSFYEPPKVTCISPNFLKADSVESSAVLIKGVGLQRQQPFDILVAFSDGSTTKTVKGHQIKLDGAYAIACKAPEFPEGAINVAVSINGQDYSGQWNEYGDCVSTNPESVVGFYAPARLDFVEPNCAPLTGGTVVTLNCTGLVDTGSLSVRFASAVPSGRLGARFAPVVVPAKFIDSTEARCIAPAIVEWIDCSCQVTVELSINGRDYDCLHSSHSTRSSEAALRASRTRHISRVMVGTKPFTYYASPQLLGVSPRFGLKNFSGSTVTVTLSEVLDSASMLFRLRFPCGGERPRRVGALTLQEKRRDVSTKNAPRRYFETYKSKIGAVIKGQIRAAKGRVITWDDTRERRWMFTPTPSAGSRSMPKASHLPKVRHSPLHVRGPRGNVHIFVAPVAGIYRIELRGAQGGNSAMARGGQGARVSAKFSLRKGQRLFFVTGHRGADGQAFGAPPPIRGAGGGGGASVVLCDGALLAVAAGGGGASVEEDGGAGGQPRKEGGAGGQPRKTPFGHGGVAHFAGGGGGWASCGESKLSGVSGLLGGARERRGPSSRLISRLQSNRENSNQCHRRQNRTGADGADGADGSNSGWTQAPVPATSSFKKLPDEDVRDIRAAKAKLRKGLSNVTIGGAEGGTCLAELLESTLTDDYFYPDLAAGGEGVYAARGAPRKQKRGSGMRKDKEDGHGLWSMAANTLVDAVLGAEGVLGQAQVFGDGYGGFGGGGAAGVESWTEKDKESDIQTITNAARRNSAMKKVKTKPGDGAEEPNEPNAALKFIRQIRRFQEHMAGYSKQMVKYHSCLHRSQRGKRHLQLHLSTYHASMDRYHTSMEKYYFLMAIGHKPRKLKNLLRGIAQMNQQLGYARNRYYGGGGGGYTGGGGGSLTKGGGAGGGSMFVTTLMPTAVKAELAAQEERRESVEGYDRRRQGSKTGLSEMEGSREQEDSAITVLQNLNVTNEERWQMVARMQPQLLSVESGCNDGDGSVSIILTAPLVPVWTDPVVGAFVPPSKAKAKPTSRPGHAVPEAAAVMRAWSSGVGGILSRPEDGWEKCAGEGCVKLVLPTPSVAGADSGWIVPFLASLCIYPSVGFEVALDGQHFVRAGFLTDHFNFLKPLEVRAVSPSMSLCTGGVQLTLHGNAFENTGEILVRFTSVPISLRKEDEHTDSDDDNRDQEQEQEQEGGVLRPGMEAAAEISQFREQLHIRKPRKKKEIRVLTVPGKFVNNNTITCTTPPFELYRRPGWRFRGDEAQFGSEEVKVSLCMHAGQFIQSKQPMVYCTPPTFKSIEPSLGPGSGGTEVRLFGNGFQPHKALSQSSHFAGQAPRSEVRVRVGEHVVDATIIDNNEISFTMPPLRKFQRSAKEYQGYLRAQFALSLALNGQQFECTGLHFVAYSKPVVHDCKFVGPVTGGTRVIIKGHGFGDNTGKTLEKLQADHRGSRAGCDSSEKMSVKFCERPKATKKGGKQVGSRKKSGGSIAELKRLTRVPSRRRTSTSTKFNMQGNQLVQEVEVEAFYVPKDEWDDPDVEEVHCTAPRFNTTACCEMFLSLNSQQYDDLKPQNARGCEFEYFTPPAVISLTPRGGPLQGNTSMQMEVELNTLAINALKVSQNLDKYTPKETKKKAKNKALYCLVKFTSETNPTHAKIVVATVDLDTGVFSLASPPFLAESSPDTTIADEYMHSSSKMMTLRLLLSISFNGGADFAPCGQAFTFTTYPSPIGVGPPVPAVGPLSGGTTIRLPVKERISDTGEIAFFFAFSEGLGQEAGSKGLQNRVDLENTLRVAGTYANGWLECVVPECVKGCNFARMLVSLNGVSIDAKGSSQWEGKAFPTNAIEEIGLDGDSAGDAVSRAQRDWSNKLEQFASSANVLARAAATGEGGVLGFSYYKMPTILEYRPNVGVCEGGTDMTIFGRDFSGCGAGPGIVSVAFTRMVHGKPQGKPIVVPGTVVDADETNEDEDDTPKKKKGVYDRLNGSKRRPKRKPAIVVKMSDMRTRVLCKAPAMPSCEARVEVTLNGQQYTQSPVQPNSLARFLREFHITTDQLGVQAAVSRESLGQAEAATEAVVEPKGPLGGENDLSLFRFFKPPFFQQQAMGPTYGGSLVVLHSVPAAGKAGRKLFERIVSEGRDGHVFIEFKSLAKDRLVEVQVRAAANLLYGERAVETTEAMPSGARSSALPADASAKSIPRSRGRDGDGDSDSDGAQPMPAGTAPATPIAAAATDVLAVQLMGYTPPMPAGFATVQIVLGDPHGGSRKTISNGEKFFFYEPPALEPDAVSPRCGPVNGETLLFIRATNLTESDLVRVRFTPLPTSEEDFAPTGSMKSSHSATPSYLRDTGAMKDAPSRKKPPQDTSQGPSKVQLFGAPDLIRNFVSREAQEQHTDLKNSVVCHAKYSHFLPDGTSVEGGVIIVASPPAKKEWGSNCVVNVSLSLNGGLEYTSSTSTTFSYYTPLEEGALGLELKHAPTRAPSHDGVRSSTMNRTIRHTVIAHQPIVNPSARGDRGLDALPSVEEHSTSQLRKTKAPMRVAVPEPGFGKGGPNSPDHMSLATPMTRGLQDKMFADDGGLNVREAHAASSGLRASEAGTGRSSVARKPRVNQDKPLAKEENKAIQLAQLEQLEDQAPVVMRVRSKAKPIGDTGFMAFGITPIMAYKEISDVLVGAAMLKENDRQQTFLQQSQLGLRESGYTAQRLTALLDKRAEAGHDHFSQRIVIPASVEEESDGMVVRSLLPLLAVGTKGALVELSLDGQVWTEVGKMSLHPSIHILTVQPKYVPYCGTKGQDRRDENGNKRKTPEITTTFDLICTHSTVTEVGAKFSMRFYLQEDYDDAKAAAVSTADHSASEIDSRRPKIAPNRHFMDYLDPVLELPAKVKSFVMDAAPGGAEQDSSAGTKSTKSAASAKRRTEVPKKRSKAALTKGSLAAKERGGSNSKARRLCRFSCEMPWLPKPGAYRVELYADGVAFSGHRKLTCFDPYLLRVHKMLPPCGKLQENTPLAIIGSGIVNTGQLSVRFTSEDVPRGQKPEVKEVRGTIGKKQLLRVHVHRAKGLKATDLNTSDPLVLINCSNDSFKTRCVEKCLDPVWDEDFVFDVGFGLGSHEVELIVEDRDLTDDNDFLGKVVISLAELSSSTKQPEPKWYKLLSEREVVDNENNPGEIQVTLHLRPRELDENKLTCLSPAMPLGKFAVQISCGYQVFSQLIDMHTKKRKNSVTPRKVQQQRNGDGDANQHCYESVTQMRRVSTRQLKLTGTMELTNRYTYYDLPKLIGYDPPVLPQSTGGMVSLISGADKGIGGRHTGWLPSAYIRVRMENPRDPTPEIAVGHYLSESVLKIVVEPQPVFVDRFYMSVALDAFWFTDGQASPLLFFFSVTHVEPACGPTIGGTLNRIHGTNLILPSWPDEGSVCNSRFQKYEPVVRFSWKAGQKMLHSIIVPGTALVDEGVIEFESPPCPHLSHLMGIEPMVELSLTGDEGFFSEDPFEYKYFKQPPIRSIHPVVALMPAVTGITIVGSDVTPFVDTGFLSIRFFMDEMTREAVGRFIDKSHLSCVVPRFPVPRSSCYQLLRNKDTKTAAAAAAAAAMAAAAAALENGDVLKPFGFKPKGDLEQSNISEQALENADDSAEEERFVPMAFDGVRVANTAAVISSLNDPTTADSLSLNNKDMTCWLPSDGVWVVVLQAKNLPVMDRSGSDPRCRLTYGSTRYYTRCQHQTVAPVWDEAFSFDIDDNSRGGTIGSGALELMVEDVDPNSDADFMGRAIIQVKDLPDGKTVQRWFKLGGMRDGGGVHDTSAMYGGSSADSKERGHVLVQLLRMDDSSTSKKTNRPHKHSSKLQLTDPSSTSTSPHSAIVAAMHPLEMSVEISLNRCDVSRLVPTSDVALCMRHEISRAKLAVVLKVSPPFGPDVGGTTCTLIGRNFGPKGSHPLLAFVQRGGHEGTPQRLLQCAVVEATCVDSTKMTFVTPSLSQSTHRNKKGLAPIELLISQNRLDFHSIFAGDSVSTTEHSETFEKVTGASSELAVSTSSWNACNHFPCAFTLYQPPQLLQAVPADGLYTTQLKLHGKGFVDTGMVVVSFNVIKPYRWEDDDESDSEGGEEVAKKKPPTEPELRAHRILKDAMSKLEIKMRLIDMFKIIDLDSSMQVTRDELEHGLNKLGLGEHLSQYSMAELLDSFDKDHDGQVDFVEFKAVMSKIDRMEETKPIVYDPRGMYEGVYAALGFARRRRRHPKFHTCTPGKLGICLYSTKEVGDGKLGVPEALVPGEVLSSGLMTCFMPEHFVPGTLVSVRVSLNGGADLTKEENEVYVFNAPALKQLVPACTRREGCTRLRLYGANIVPSSEIKVKFTLIGRRTLPIPLSKKMAKRSNQVESSDAGKSGVVGAVSIDGAGPQPEYFALTTIRSQLLQQMNQAIAKADIANILRLVDDKAGPFYKCVNFESVNGDAKGMTPLMAAMRDVKAKAFERDMEKDAYTAQQEKLRRQQVREQHITTLLERGSDLDQVSSVTGETALFFAARLGQAALVEFMCLKGARVDVDMINATTGKVSETLQQTYLKQQEQQLLDLKQKNMKGQTDDHEHIPVTKTQPATGVDEVASVVVVDGTFNPLGGGFIECVTPAFADLGTSAGHERKDESILQAARLGALPHGQVEELLVDLLLSGEAEGAGVHHHHGEEKGARSKHKSSRDEYIHEYTGRPLRLSLYRRAAEIHKIQPTNGPVWGGTKCFIEGKDFENTGQAKVRLRRLKFDTVSQLKKGIIPDPPHPLHEGVIDEDVCGTIAELHTVPVKYVSSSEVRFTMPAFAGEGVVTVQFSLDGVEYTSIGLACCFELWSSWKSRPKQVSAPTLIGGGPDGHVAWERHRELKRGLHPIKQSVSKKEREGGPPMVRNTMDQSISADFVIKDGELIRRPGTRPPLQEVKAAAMQKGGTTKGITSTAATGQKGSSAKGITSTAATGQRGSSANGITSTAVTGQRGSSANGITSTAATGQEGSAKGITSTTATGQGQKKVKTKKSNQAEKEMVGAKAEKKGEKETMQKSSTKGSAVSAKGGKSLSSPKMQIRPPSTASRGKQHQRGRRTFRQTMPILQKTTIRAGFTGHELKDRLATVHDADVRKYGAKKHKLVVNFVGNGMHVSRNDRGRLKRLDARFKTSGDPGYQSAHEVVRERMHRAAAYAAAIAAAAALCHSSAAADAANKAVSKSGLGADPLATPYNVKFNAVVNLAIHMTHEIHHMHQHLLALHRRLHPEHYQQHHNQELSAPGASNTPARVQTAPAASMRQKNPKLKAVSNPFGLSTKTAPAKPHVDAKTALAPQRPSTEPGSKRARATTAAKPATAAAGAKRGESTSRDSRLRQKHQGKSGGSRVEMTTRTRNNGFVASRPQSPIGFMKPDVLGIEEGGLSSLKLPVVLQQADGRKTGKRKSLLDTLHTILADSVALESEIDPTAENYSAILRSQERQDQIYSNAWEQEKKLWADRLRKLFTDGEGKEVRLGYRQLCVEGIASMMADMLVTQEEITSEARLEAELLEVWTTVDPHNKGIVSAEQFFRLIGGPPGIGGRHRPPSPSPGPSHYDTRNGERLVKSRTPEIGGYIPAESTAEGRVPPDTYEVRSVSCMLVQYTHDVCLLVRVSLRTLAWTIRRAATHPPTRRQQILPAALALTGMGGLCLVVWAKEKRSGLTAIGYLLSRSRYCSRFLVPHR